MTNLNSKASNPKDMIGASKLPLHLWPTTATAMGCIGLLEGMLKYGRSNWREAGVRASIYVDACKRHLDAWFEGEEVAPDSGSPHLANALACLAILVDAQACGKLVDDRAYNGAGYRKLVEELTPHVAHLKDLFKDKSPKHWTIADNVAAEASQPSSLPDLPFEYRQLLEAASVVVNEAIHTVPVNSPSWHARILMKDNLRRMARVEALKQ